VLFRFIPLTQYSGPGSGPGAGSGPGGWGGHMTMFPGSGLTMILLMVLVLLAGFWLLSALRKHSGGNAPEDARTLLDRRYARGEIDRETYLLMKRDLKEED